MAEGSLCNILVIGACGQIGSELTLALRDKFGQDKVIASGRKTPPSDRVRDSGPFAWLDVTDFESIRDFCVQRDVKTIINMAAILSATGEADPDLCWKVNIDGLFNCLKLAREVPLKQVLVPSSIAVFGPTTPKIAPQETILAPSTMYGITKVSGELLGDYYVSKFGVDVRGLRYPGIISNAVLPGGGTTDYAVEIFYSAVKYGRYKCFLAPDTRLPMMYMPDCIKATIDLMVAPFESLKHHSTFNLGAMSFTPAELAKAIQVHIPEFEMEYDVDMEVRQKIADSWPQAVDDSVARDEWGWEPKFGLAEMTEDMLSVLGERHRAGTLNYVNPDFETG